VNLEKSDLAEATGLKTAQPNAFRCVGWLGFMVQRQYKAHLKLNACFGFSAAMSWFELCAVRDWFPFTYVKILSEDAGTFPRSGDPNSLRFVPALNWKSGNGWPSV
jgi:hypothetical protein